MLIKESFGPSDFERLVDEENATASRLIFTDQSILDIEQEKVFTKAWLYVGHDTEIPNVGDYVTRQMALDPVILVRAEDGKPQVLLNSCSHRGTQVCGTDVGNTKGFVCPYHGWVFGLDGGLKATADDMDLYEGKVDFKTLDLTKAAQVGSYAGLIFATWNEEADSLEDYLGDARWYLDLFHNRTPEGMEVLGPPQRWVVNTNWKLGAMNFAADGPHAVQVHGPITAATFNVPPSIFRDALVDSPAVSMGNGHNGIFTQIPEVLKDQVPPYLGTYPDLIPVLESHLDPKQTELNRHLLAGVTTMFPNFSSVQGAITFDNESLPVNFLGIRVWQPISATETEIWNWFLVEKEAPQEWKESAAKAGVRTFTPCGTFDQDDAEAWVAINKGISGTMSRKGDINFQMALAYRDKTIPDFPGPGRAYPSNYGEVTEFDVLLEWQKYMKT
ncbi:MAG: Rieske 2Fe-2S domain-containing protein [Immundisolibacteraceae bacterium]|nr:Rieske 2Fe-2S domain-containing protein [Immundisolibacteraceae bacterium]